jgi:hypothetical protein
VKWTGAILFLRRLRCPHLRWEPIDSVITPLSEDHISVSWSNQRCMRCGLLREGSIMLPGESVSIPLDEYF